VRISIALRGVSKEAGLLEEVEHLNTCDNLSTKPILKCLGFLDIRSSTLYMGVHFAYYKIIIAKIMAIAQALLQAD